MRSHKGLFLLGVAVLLCSTVAFWGCGDDDTSTNWGEMNDPNFQAVNSQFEQYVDSTLTWMTDAFSSMSTLPGDGQDPVHYGPSDPNAETDSLSVSYTGGWHVVYLNWHNAANYAGNLTDSIQFLIDGTPSQEAANLDALTYSHNWSWLAPDTTVTYRNTNGFNRVSFTGLDGQQATVDGSSEFQSKFKYVSQDSVVWRDVNITSTLTNFTINKTGSGWAQNCPSSGQINATVTMTYQKDDGTPVESTWNFSAVFENGSLTTTVTSGQLTWSYSRDKCIPVSM